MPADSHTHNPRRTVARKLTTDEEIDIRRARGEISCAECRRLKLKCDKKLPCSSCIRRGCPSICPNGSLSTGQGTRFILADTTQLHAKIAEMGQRIRQLEDALAIFQAGVSNETHPLLREELLSIKFGPEKGHILDKGAPSRQSSIDSSIDAMGTMTIGDRGEGKYFGPSAGSEALFLAGAELEPPPDEDLPVPAEIARFSACFPFGSDGNLERAYDLLFDYLPNQPRAWSLCETYMEHAAWAFRPIKRDEIIDDILSPAYKALKERQTTGALNTQLVSSHKLAVLFLVFALGALVDLTLEPYNQEAETYYHLSRACLSQRSVFDSPEVSTVQAVLLLAAYHGMAGKRYTMDSSWTLTSLGAKLAQSIGLHRDSARWNMDPKTVERRRSLFWELYSSELFYCLALGRPPSLRLSYVDCEFPIDDEATMDGNGNTLIGYYRWKYEFTKEIFPYVIEMTLTAKAPSYQTILDLDKKVREKVLPPHLNVFMSPEDEHCTPSVYMRGCLLGQYRSVTLLYIHRSFFAQAMLDHPANPLRSPYAPSFLAAYRCASGVIKSNLNHYDRFPELCGRWWSIWTHLFSAAVIVGSIVTRSPSSSMASSAFIELGLACDLFEKGAMQSRRARSGLAILFKMRNKAFQVYSQFRSGNHPVTNVLSVGGPDYGDDELALFGGQTKILVSKLLSNTGYMKRKVSSPSNATSSVSPESISAKLIPNAKEASPDVHPSLLEYLSMFPPSNVPTTMPSPLSAAGTPGLPDLQPSHSALPPLPPMESPDFTQEPIQMSSPELQNAWSPWDKNGSVFSFMSPRGYTTVEPTSYMHMSNNGFPSTNTVPTIGIKTDAPESGNLMDLGMMMSGESGMDEQWMSFMRDSGLLDPNLYMPGPGVPTYNGNKMSAVGQTTTSYQESR